MKSCNSQVKETFTKRCTDEASKEVELSAERTECASSSDGQLPKTFERTVTLIEHLHRDIIKQAFWNEHPEILGNES